MRFRNQPEMWWDRIWGSLSSPFFFLGFLFLSRFVIYLGLLTLQFSKLQRPLFFFFLLVPLLSLMLQYPSLGQMHWKYPHISSLLSIDLPPEFTLQLLLCDMLSCSVLSDSLQPHGLQAPLSMGLSKQESWGGQSFLSRSGTLVSCAAGRCFTS